MDLQLILNYIDILSNIHKKIQLKVTVYSVIISTVLWSLGLPFASWTLAPTANAAAPFILSAIGTVGSNTIAVTFSEAVRQVGGASLINTNFMFQDNSGGAAKTISGVAHVANTNTATITLSGNLIAGDVDNSPSIINLIGNAVDTATNTAVTPMPAGIIQLCPDFSAGGGTYNITSNCSLATNKTSNHDIVIASTSMMMIKNNAVLTIANGTALTLNGQLAILNGSTLTNNGTTTINGFLKNDGIVNYGTATCNGAMGGMITGTGVNNPGMPVCGTGAGNPNIIFTNPPSAMNNIPTDHVFKIFFAFDRPMSSSTIADADASDAGSNIWLTNDWGATKIAGAVHYYTDTNACAAGEGANSCPPMMQNIGVFVPAAVFSSNKTYELHVEPGAVDTNGFPVNSNFNLTYYSLTFSTGGGLCVSNCGTAGADGGFGSFTPPFVQGVMPMPGSFDKPTNTLIGVNFSKPMDSTTLISTNIKLYTVNADWTDGAPITLAVTVNQTGDAIKITPAGLSTNTNYRLKILGDVKSQDGVKMDPSGTNAPMWTSEFKTGSTGADVTAPTISFSYPANTATGISTVPGSIDLFASKSLDPDTINTNSVTLKTTTGSVPVSGTVKYDAMAKSISFMPTVALGGNTQYTIAALSTITDFTAGANTLTAFSSSFTTGGADVTVPAIVFASADDYKMEVNFNVPMKSAPNAADSVINNSNITIKQGATGSNVSAANATLKYDATMKKLIIQGLNLTIGNDFIIILSNVKGLNDEAIGASSAVGPVIAPVTNAGMAGGGSGGGATGAGTSGGTTAFMPTNFNSATFGFVQQANASPFSMMAGRATTYHIGLPISKQIDTGGTIVLTFPRGFDISNAKQDVNSPQNNDFNGPGANTPKFGAANDGITVDTNANTVTVTLNGATDPSGYDFLNFDLAGIINSTIPQDWNTSGYTISINTKNSSNTVLENISTSPFYIQAAGAYSLVVTLNLGASGGTSTAKVYLVSPMTGPMEGITNAFNAADGTVGPNDTKVTFSGLTSGNYSLFTDSILTLGGADYVGVNPPININVSGATTKSITLAGDGTSATAVTVNITGPANEALDIFAGSPNGQKTKSVTLNGGGTATVTLNLTNGDWFLGVGPQTPKGMSAGMPPQPNYIVPQPQNINIANPACLINGASTCTATFTLSSANKTLKGKVQDASGKVISNAQVWAYDPAGGFGTFAQADTNGQFDLKLIEGQFKIGAALPGMPSTKEVLVEISGGNMKVDGGASQVLPVGYTGFTLTMAKPDYTITGLVTDASGAVIKDAAIHAYQTNGPGNANANSGSDGKYTLYVGNGSWKVGAYLPGYGPLPEQTVTIASANQSSINFSPTLTGETYYAVSGNVSVTGAGNIANAFVHVESTAAMAGQFRLADAVTDASGNYTVSVPAGTYKITAFHPTYGDFAPLNNVVVSGILGGKNLTKTAAQAITINIKDSSNAAKTVTEAYVDFFDTTNKFGNFLNIKNGSSGTLNLPNGNYEVHVHIPGVIENGLTVAGGGGTTIAAGVLTVDGAEVINVTLPSLYTLSGQVTSSGSAVNNAWVEVSNDTTGFHFGASTDASGNYSMNIPAGTYKITAMKPGYSGQRSNVTVSANKTQNLILDQATLIISGSVTAGGSAAPYAFVRAEKVNDNVIVGAQADASGNYSLNVSSGQWNLYAVADGYKPKRYDAANDGTGDTLSISSNTSGINFALTDVVVIASPLNQPITPSQGGTVSAPNMGVRLTIPANALNTGNSAGNINVKETSNIIKTASAAPLGKAKELTATDSNGQEIKNFNDSINLEMTYTKAELDAAFTDLGMTAPTLADVNNLELSYWDETTGAWMNRPSTITITPASAAVYSDITSVTVKGSTTHFTIFAIVMPFVTTVQAASTGGGNNGGGGGGGGSGLPFYLLTPSSGQTKTTDSQTTKTDPAKSSSDNWLSNLTKKVTQQVSSIVNDAKEIVAKGFDATLKKLGIKRNASTEKTVAKTVDVMAKTVSANTAAKKTITDFIVYGTEQTSKLTKADRTQATSAYKNVFGKLPTTETQWADLIRIAKGETPQTKNAKAETDAAKEFKKIYGRAAKATNTADKKAIDMIAYGLLSTTKNTKAEKTATDSFKKIYKHAPKTDKEIIIARAMAYSGIK